MLLGISLLPLLGDFDHTYAILGPPKTSRQDFEANMGKPINVRTCHSRDNNETRADSDECERRL